jgi:UDP-N-acetyl-D-mannosaminuronate dehydrogenase
VYPYFLTRESKRLGVPQRLPEIARAVNDAQPARHVQRLARVWQPLENRRVHILGLGFRPGVKVDTFSSAYAVCDELVKHKAIVTLEDPFYSDEEIRCAGFTPARVGSEPLDAVILNTAHAEFADVDFDLWRATGIEAVVDGRDLWDPGAVQRAGLLYLGVGRGADAAPILDGAVECGAKG